MARPGFAKLLSLCVIPHSLSSSPGSGTAAPAGELALRNVCVCWPAVLVKIFPEKRVSSFSPSLVLTCFPGAAFSSSHSGFQPISWKSHNWHPGRFIRDIFVFYYFLDINFALGSGAAPSLQSD